MLSQVINVILDTSVSKWCGVDMPGRIRCLAWTVCGEGTLAKLTTLVYKRRLTHSKTASWLSAHLTLFSTSLHFWSSPFSILSSALFQQLQFTLYRFTMKMSYRQTPLLTHCVKENIIYNTSVCSRYYKKNICK